MRSLTLLLLLMSAPILLPAQDPHDADRQALLKILKEVEGGINAQNIDQILSQMDADATVTWLNGEISRGHKDIKDYYQRMMKSEGRILDRYTSVAKLGGPARFLGNGDVAIAHGSSEDEFFPVARGPFRLSSRWTSTIAKVDGQWKIVNLHLSSNVFTNELIHEAIEALWYVGFGALFVGVLIGWFGRRYILRR